MSTDTDTLVETEAPPFTPPPYKEINDAYWAWVDAECPHPKGSTDRKAWLKTNDFVYQGVKYRKESVPQMSNSRKSIVGWDTTYFALVNGKHYGISFENWNPNRQNDPARGFGLGRKAARE